MGAFFNGKIQMQTLEQKLTELLAPPLEHQGLELVQLKMVDGAKRKTLQVMVENAETGRVTVDECAKASRTISMLLDVEDTISGAFNLEVGSPGIDRPLVKRADFERFLGFDAKLEVKLPIDGRRRFKGQLLSLEDDELTMLIDHEKHIIAIGNIANAKLILTDALLKAYQDGTLRKQKETTEGVD